MKERYIELMEKVLSAYTDEHIRRYYNDVKTNGLTEHGFPRLTANIGILIANGRRKDLLLMFADMMDVCCDAFLRPGVKSANEFSVREIVCCIDEIEKAQVVDKEHVARWKKKISQIIPEACYDVLVKEETDRITNWAIFGAVSEYARFYFGLGENLEFVDRQLSCQFQWLDENGMYCDYPKVLIHQPVMYDYVSRGLFATLLNFGYSGKYYKQIDDCLKKAGLLTLKMQSSNGEAPFGGRSNQFVHNEAWMMGLFEYEAKRYKKEKNVALAMKFKSAVDRAFNSIETWLNKKPIRHIKNRFPTETKYGCESYAYFDKYMITVASNLYAAYLLCDDSIATEVACDHESEVFQTSYRFHKLFLKSGGYALEFDTNADSHYEASGLGRVHRENAPPTICLSCSCPVAPYFTVDIEKPIPFSLCSAISIDGCRKFGAQAGGKYEVIESKAFSNRACATLVYTFENGDSVKEHYTVNENGVSIKIEGDGEVGYTLPAFCFDGQISPKITVEKHLLTVAYEGWICRYITDGTILDLNQVAANRNGHYRAFLAIMQNVLNVKIEIVKA